jgi:uncharacterized protein (TIGR03435 family)
MRRALFIVPVLAFACGLASGQPAFEAADVHVSPPGATESGGFLPGGRVEFRATTLLRLIGVAYSVPPDRVSGGPSWIDTDRFDLIAIAPAGASQIALRTMLQNLLADRLGLSVQTEEKPQPVYILTMGKRGPPKESAKPGDPDCKRTTEENLLTLTCHNMSMAALAESLPGAAPAYFSGRAVLDRTGLEGVYDFKLQWVGRGQLPPGPEGLKNSLSIFSSIEKQLGVTLVPDTANTPVLTVARANRVPAGNPPGVTEKLGRTPTEFDVAEVRPSGPDEHEDFKMENGRIEAKAVALRDLIEFAYDAEDDALKGGAKWLDSAKFDIVAKTAPTASPDTLRAMLQSLLAQRFGLKVHKDRQPVTVYALTALKPKLKDADSSERSTCTMSLADGGRAYTCQNVTMAQFAEKLRGAAQGYIDHPVVDLTGLTGTYDFSARWAPRGRTLGRAGAAPAASGDGAAAGPASSSPDPTAELTVFEAIERQLGLKLAVRKHPMPVVVIDRVERKPTEN